MVKKSLNDNTGPLPSLFPPFHPSHATLQAHATLSRNVQDNRVSSHDDLRSIFHFHAEHAVTVDATDELPPFDLACGLTVGIYAEHRDPSTSASSITHAN